MNTYRRCVPNYMEKIMPREIVRRDCMWLAAHHPRTFLYRLAPILRLPSEKLVIKEISETELTVSCAGTTRFFLQQKYNPIFTSSSGAILQYRDVEFYATNWALGSPIEILDNGALFTIFKFLDVKSLKACLYVCQKFKKVLQQFMFKKILK